MTVIPSYARAVNKGVVSAAAGALLWGTLGPVAALFDTGDRIAAGGIRLGIGAVVLLAVAKGRPIRKIWTRADLFPLVGGAVGIAGFQLAYFGAITSAGVAVSTAVGIGLSPVFTGLWTVVKDRRPPATGWLIGTALALGGLTLLAVTEGGVTMSPAGLGLSVLAAAMFSMQAICIGQLTERHSNATALTGIFGLGALIMSPVIAVTASPNLLAPQGIGGVLYLGVVTTGLSYWLFARGIRQIGAASAVTITLLEPAAAAVLAAVFLHEALSAGQWAGIALIGAAIPITGRSTTAPTTEPELSSAAVGS